MTGRPSRALSFACAIVTVLALGAAALVLVRFAVSLPDTESISGILFPVLATLALIGGGAGLVGAVVLLARHRPTAALGLAAAIFVLIRSAVVVAFDGPLTSDWRAYHQLAIGWTLGAPPIANRSMGFPAVLGEAYRIAGVNPEVGEILNLLLTFLGAVLLAALVEKLADRRTAAVAVAVLAVAPSQAFFTVLLGTETLYTTALVAVAYLAVVMLVWMRSGGTARRAVLLGAAVGLVLGVSTYVRATSVVIVPFIAVLPFLAAPWRKAMPVALAVVAVAVVALVPAVAINRTFLDRWSPSTTLFTGWQLYLGTNVQEAGRFNDADSNRANAAVAGYDPGRLSAEYAKGIFDPATLQLSAERDDRALQLAFERIRRDGLRLPLVIPLKVVYAWGPADSSAGWVLPTEGSGDTAAARIAQVASQVWWVAVLAFAAFWFLRRRRTAPLAAMVVGAIVVPIALSLLVLEVQPRYHEYVVPLFVALAAMAIVRPAGVAKVTGDVSAMRVAMHPEVGNHPHTIQSKEDLMGIEQPTQEPQPEDTADELDVEGHSRVAALFIGTTARAQKSDPDKAAAKAADESLTPLTKRFPRMRDDSRK